MQNLFFDADETVNSLATFLAQELLEYFLDQVLFNYFCCSESSEKGKYGLFKEGEMKDFGYLKEDLKIKECKIDAEVQMNSRI